MPLPDALALRIGRADLAQSDVMPTGTTVSNGGGLSASASLTLGGGRDSLILIAALVIGVIALSYWTR